MSKSTIHKRPFTLLLILTLFAFTINVTFAYSPLQITVKTDKTSYQLRENVNIFGNVTYNGQLANKGLAGIQVEGPLGTIITRTRPVGPIGSQNFDIEILLVTLCDQQGNPKQTTIRGSATPAYAKVKIKNNGYSSKNVVVTATIYDNDTIPIVVIAREKPDLLPGATFELGDSFYIDSWRKNGTATIYANVYSDWPENNGCPYCPEKTATFAILESEYDDSLPAQAPEEPIQNGTYTAKFRLSPEPTPGTYIVSATARYEGWKTDNPSITTFQVVDVTAPPRASFVIKPPKAGPNFQVKFDASSSTAEGYDDTIKSYAWDFGDTQHATGKIVYHTYPVIGNYVVTLNITDNEEYWNTTSKIAIITTIHNVAVTELSCLNDIYNNWLVQVSIKVKNLGTVNESFNVTLYANSTFAGKSTVNSLGPQLSTTLLLTWNTSGLIPLKNYTIKAMADILIGETDTEDNSLEYGPIFVRLLGDVRFDREIGILDVVSVTAIYGLKKDDPRWNIMADLNPDGKIDILDIVKITSKYGQKY